MEEKTTSLLVYVLTEEKTTSLLVYVLTVRAARGVRRREHGEEMREERRTGQVRRKNQKRKEKK